MTTRSERMTDRDRDRLEDVRRHRQYIAELRLLRAHNQQHAEYAGATTTCRLARDRVERAIDELITKAERTERRGCERCAGSGTVGDVSLGTTISDKRFSCPACHGTGEAA